jgi:GTPase involved in cell partitioning and DNA repair
MVPINNINSYDLMLVNKKGSPNNHLLGKQDEYKNIDEEVRKYKVEIKTKIDKLLNSYLDDNEKEKTYNKKYKHHFHNFLMSVIENTERQEIKNLVSNDLSGINLLAVITTDDICYNLLLIDKNLMEDNQNTTKKISNLNNFVNVSNPLQKIKILPRIIAKR